MAEENTFAGDWEGDGMWRGGTESGFGCRSRLAIMRMIIAREEAKMRSPD
jgi:hypothetical protein